eukprot:g4104.t1
MPCSKPCTATQRTRRRTPGATSRVAGRLEQVAFGDGTLKDLKDRAGGSFASSIGGDPARAPASVADRVHQLQCRQHGRGAFDMGVS